MNLFSTILTLQTKSIQIIFFWQEWQMFSRQDDLKTPPPSLQVSTCLQCLSPIKSYFVLSNNFSTFWDFFGTQNLKFLCRSTQWCILRSNFELKLIHEFEILPNCLKCLISKKQNHLHRSVGFLVSTKQILRSVCRILIHHIHFCRFRY